jgi:hypothetical protein
LEEEAVEDEEADLEYEVQSLSRPFEVQKVVAALHVDFPGKDPNDAVVDRLVEGGVTELRLVLSDYGQPHAPISVESKPEEYPGGEPSQVTSILVTTDESTADLINDHMNDHLAPLFRRELDAAGRDRAKVSTFLDGWLRWF